MVLISALCLLAGGRAGTDILLYIRLPRVLAGLLCGAALGGAGAVMQGVLRNPLADPYVLGASSGAALGAVVCVFLGLSYFSPLFYAVCVLLSFGAVFAALVLARSGGRTNIVSLILAGVVINIFLSAVVYMFFILRRSDAYSLIIFMLGSVSEKSYGVLAACAVLFAAGFIPAVFASRVLDILSLGEIKAAEIGVKVEKFKILLLLCACFMTAAAVTLAGPVGFVGLIVPHIIRFIFGPKTKNVLLFSALGGGILTAGVDAISRALFAPAEFPIGIFMAFIGVPFFIWLLKKRKDYFF